MICMNCGHYAGRKVIDMAAKVARKASKKAALAKAR
jgi:hypothetical protein